MTNSIAKNLAALAISLMISLVVGEWIARFALRDITTTSDNRSYFAQRWKAANVRLNTLGYREREFPRDKPAGMFRIAFIGDSFAFGQGIPEEARMSNLLQDALIRRRPKSEVLNFGNAGNSTADEVRVLQTVLDGLDPDFVVLQWFVNDVEVQPRPGTPRSANAGNKLKVTLRNHSVLYFLAAETWHRFLDSTSASYSNDMFRRFGRPESEASRQADAALLEFMRTAKAHSVPLAVVLVPHLAPTTGSDYAFAYLHQRVLAACRREHVPCVDLLDTFSPYLAKPGGAKQLWVNQFDSHMGPKANQLAAAELFRALGPLWMPGQT